MKKFRIYQRLGILSNIINSNANMPLRLAIKQEQGQIDDLSRAGLKLANLLENFGSWSVRTATKEHYRWKV